MSLAFDFSAREVINGVCALANIVVYVVILRHLYRNYIQTAIAQAYQEWSQKLNFMVQQNKEVHSCRDALQQQVLFMRTWQAYMQKSVQQASDYRRAEQAQASRARNQWLERAALDRVTQERSLATHRALSQKIPGILTKVHDRLQAGYATPEAQKAYLDMIMHDVEKL